MLNLVRVFCLLLVATATSAQDPLDSAKKSFEEIMTSLLAEVENSYIENAKCVRAAQSRLESEVENLVPGLKIPSNQPALPSSIHKGPLDVNNPNSGLGKMSEQVMKILENRKILFEAKSKELNEAFKKVCGSMNETQVSYEVCASLGSDNIFTREEAAARIKVHRQTLLRQVVKAKSHFLEICEEADGIMENTVSHLKFVISNQ